MTLRELRDEKKLSQRDVAALMGVTQPAVQRLERRGSTTLETFERYADALGCSFDEVRKAAKVTRGEAAEADNSESSNDEK